MNTLHSTPQMDLFQTVQKAYVSGSLVNQFETTSYKIALPLNSQLTP